MAGILRYDGLHSETKEDDEMYCRVCGKELPDGAVRCDECGTPVEGRCDNSNQTNQTNQNNTYSYGGSDASGENSYYQDNRSQYQYQQAYSNGYGQPVYEHQSDGRKGFAIASLVLGIIGLVGSCCSMVTFGVLSLLLGVVGLILGILGLKSQSKGIAIAGIVMAGLNLIIGVLLLILMVASLSMTANITPDELEALYESMEYWY